MRQYEILQHIIYTGKLWTVSDLKGSLVSKGIAKLMSQCIRWLSYWSLGKFLVSRLKFGRLQTFRVLPPQPHWFPPPHPRGTLLVGPCFSPHRALQPFTLPPPGFGRFCVVKTETWDDGELERCLFSRLGPKTLSSCGGARGVGWLGPGGGSWCWLVLVVFFFRRLYEWVWCWCCGCPCGCGKLTSFEWVFVALYGENMRVLRGWALRMVDIFVGVYVVFLSKSSSLDAEVSQKKGFHALELEQLWWLFSTKSE